MATKPKAAASQPETVTVPRSALKALLDFYNAAEAADAAYIRSRCKLRVIPVSADK